MILLLPAESSDSLAIALQYPRSMLSPIAHLSTQTSRVSSMLNAARTGAENLEGGSPWLPVFNILVCYS